MSVIRVNLPDSLKEFLDAHVAEAGYPTADALICELLTEVQQRKAQERLDALLAEGLESEASELTRADWDELKRQVWERHAKRNGS